MMKKNGPSPQISASPAMQAKLAASQKEVADNKYTFTVGYTEASTRPMSALCGFIESAPVSAEAIKAQDEMNAKIIQKAEAQMKQQGIAVPKLHNSASSGGVGAGPSVSATPSVYFGGRGTEGGYLPPVRDQGQCGSCWAFAACSAYETAFRKWYGWNRDINMSEQEILDCGKTYFLGIFAQDAGSCGGGYSDRALDYIKNYGGATESNRPYVAHDQGCAGVPKKFYAWCWGQFGADIQKIKDVVYGYGSVVTSIQAQGSFMDYKSGIINYRASGHNHAVTIVGWNDAYQSWIIRNSWGESWGYRGYGYIRYDACNIGQTNRWIYPYNAGGAVSAGAGGVAEGPPMPLEESPILKAARQ